MGPEVKGESPETPRQVREDGEGKECIQSLLVKRLLCSRHGPEDIGVKRSERNHSKEEHNGGKPAHGAS